MNTGNSTFDTMITTLAIVFTLACLCTLGIFWLLSDGNDKTD